MTDILECPCAAEHNSPYTTVCLEFDRVNKLYRIWCHNCYDFFTHWHHTEEEAIEEWNRIVSSKKMVCWDEMDMLGCDDSLIRFVSNKE